MPLSFFARKLGLCLGLVVATPLLVFAQSGYAPEGGEYAIAGSLAGDQNNPDVSLGVNGGYIVWEDNATDGSGQGISMRKTDSSLSGVFSVSRVNQIGAADQQNPKVCVLDGGGAAFVWQGGPANAQQIYARFRSSSNTWITDDVLVNTYTNSHHQNVAISPLTNGNVVVVWSSFDQDGSLQGVYGQRFSPAGVKLGGEFAVNTTTALNQRTPSVAGLSDGNFIVVWVNESQVSETKFDVSVAGRLFSASGTPVSGEIWLETSTNVCANPSVAASPAGGFMVAWGERDLTVRDNGWDIWGRTFSNNGAGGTAIRLNTMQFGDQYAPKVAALGGDYLVVWTSLGQDSSWEGVYGQFVRGAGTLLGGEFRLNTSVMSKQINPVVASDGNARFLGVWSSFVGGISSFDLYAQRYVIDTAPLPAPGAPFVTVLSSNTLSLTWPAMTELSISNYEVYMDGSAAPTAITTDNWWAVTNLAASSTHTFKLAYVVTDGRRSPLSAPASGTTYGALASGGIPFDWMIEYYGPEFFGWPAPNADTDGDGATTRDEFLAGTSPVNTNSVLRIRLEPTPNGLFLSWNTVPGLIYQVQSAAGFGAWTNLGGPRFGADTNMYVGGAGAGYYRIVRLR